jgi:hypothetical protein
LVIWHVSIADDGSVEIDLLTEPWNDVATNEWKIPEYVRESFKDMGGTIADAVPTPVTPQTGDTDGELTGWRVLITLPPTGSD